MANKSYPVQKDGVSFEVQAFSPEEARAKAEKTDVSTVPRLIAREGTRVFERPNGQRRMLCLLGLALLTPRRWTRFCQGMTAGEVTRKDIDKQ